MRLLLDEHFPPEVAALLRRRCPGLEVAALGTWQKGRRLGCGDDELLAAAAAEGRTLVTFDVNTIPSLLQRMAVEGRNHCGVVFVSSRSFRQNDRSSLAAALADLVRHHGQDDWTDRSAFLTRG